MWWGTTATAAITSQSWERPPGLMSFPVNHKALLCSQLGQQSGFLSAGAMLRRPEMNHKGITGIRQGEFSSCRSAGSPGTEKLERGSSPSVHPKEPISGRLSSRAQSILGSCDPPAFTQCSQDALDKSSQTPNHTGSESPGI